MQDTSVDRLTKQSTYKPQSAHMFPIPELRQAKEEQTKTNIGA